MAIPWPTKICAPQYKRDNDENASLSLTQPSSVRNTVRSIMAEWICIITLNDSAVALMFYGVERSLRMTGLTEVCTSPQIISVVVPGFQLFTRFPHCLPYGRGVGDRAWLRPPVTEHDSCNMRIIGSMCQSCSVSKKYLDISYVSLVGSYQHLWFKPIQQID